MSSVDLSGGRWTTLRASGREWRHGPLMNEAFMRGVPEDAITVTAVFAGADASDGQEEPWRLWIERPDKIRAEFVVGNETVIAVIDGDTWWSWSPWAGARTNGGDPHMEHGT